MTRKEALDELIAKVEANADVADVCQTLGVMAISEPWDFCSQSISAYRGSLDAAKALHEAVLPGWPYTIENVTGQTYRAWTDKARNLRQPGFSERDPCPARAWLLAILRALHDQAETCQ